MRLLSKRLLLVRATTASVVLAALVAGCAAPAEHPALGQAVAAVERARGAPRVRALAAAELDRAEVALEQAGAAARAGASPDQVAHLAYVVSQRAALAEARAAERVARSEIGKLQRALGQVLAHGRLEQEGQARGQPRREVQRERALAQIGLEQDRQAWASSAQLDQQANAPLEEDQYERGSVQQDPQTRAPPEEGQSERPSVQKEQETRAPLKQDQRERALVQRDPQTGTALEEDQQERALGKALAHGRPAQDRQVWAPPAHRDQQADTLEVDQQGRASVQQDLETRAVLEEDERKGALVQQDQQARMPLEQDQRERASVREDQPTRAPLKQAQLEHASAERDQEARTPLEEDQLESASREPDRPERASLKEDQQTHRAQPDDRAAIVGTMLQDITLSLAQLRFEGAEPTSDTLQELAALAERLLGEPGRSILIEADFDLPGPEARTEMERRVEAVRAILVRRGIEPARLVVRPAGAAPAEPPASSSVVAPPD
jgi:Domain of unknown function (DUF4398)